MFSLNRIVELVPDIRVTFGVGHDVSECRIDMFMEFSKKRKVVFMNSYRDNLAWMKYDLSEPIFIYNNGYFNKDLVAQHIGFLSTETDKDFYVRLFEMNMAHLEEKDEIKRLRIMAYLSDLTYVLYGYGMKDYVDEKLRIPFIDET